MLSGSTREPRPPGTSQGAIERETEAANRDTGQESNRGPGHQGELRPHYCSDNEIWRYCAFCRRPPAACHCERRWPRGWPPATARSSSFYRVVLLLSLLSLLLLLLLLLSSQQTTRRVSPYIRNGDTFHQTRGGCTRVKSAARYTLSLISNDTMR